ncbi:MAG: hypothetical protein AB1725_04480 [Armatimonadota bacterium]
MNALPTPARFLLWPAAGALLGLVVALAWPKQYEAKSTLFFAKPSLQNPLNALPLAGLAAGSLGSAGAGTSVLGGQLFLPTVGTDAASIADVLASRSAALHAIERHKSALFRDEPDDEDVEEFLESVKTEVLQTGQLAVSFTWGDRQASQAVLSDLIAYADERSKELGKQFAAKTVQFLEEEFEKQRMRVRAKAEEVKAAVSSDSLAASAVAREKFVEALLQSSVELDGLLAEAQAADAALNQKIRAVVQARDAGETGEPLTVALENLHAAILEQRAKLEQARAAVSPDSPEMQAVRAQLDASVKVYTEELDRIADAAQMGALSLTLSDSAERAAKFAALRAAQRNLARMRDDALKIANLAVEQGRLLNELRREEAQLDAALTDLTQARLAEEKAYVPFVVLDEPYASEEPSFPLPGVFAAVGVLLGLIVSVWNYTRSLEREIVQEEV